MNMFFTSDHHFSHTNIIQYCGRPFSSVEEMDEAMVWRWNQAVKPTDSVYFLGDFTLGNATLADSFLQRLNGKIYMLEGNHDKGWFRKNYFFGNKVQFLPPLYKLNFDGQMIILCHYPMRSWQSSEHGSWHLFGHEHGRFAPQGLSFDAGVDCNNFYPFSFEEVKTKMNSLSTWK